MSPPSFKYIEHKDGNKTGFKCHFHMQVPNFSKKKYFALKRTRDHFPVMLRGPRTNERELKQR